MTRRCPGCGFEQVAEVCGVCAGRIPARAPGNPLAAFARGFGGYFTAAGQLLRVPGATGLLVVPMALSALLLTGGTWAALEFAVTPALHWLQADPDSAVARFLVAFAMAVAAVALVLLGLWLLVPILHPLVLAPFLDPLAARVERTVLGRDPPAGPGVLPEALRIVAFGLLVASLQVLLLLVGFFTAPGGITVLLVMALNAWLAAVTWLDHPLARRGFSVGGRFGFAARHWGLTLGLGLGYQVGLLIPVFNLLLAAPAAAVAATRVCFGRY